MSFDKHPAFRFDLSTIRFALRFQTLVSQKMFSLRASLVSLFYLATVAISADTEAWKSRNIYFALTDRIARNSNDAGGDSCGDLGSYCGGTFQGLQSKLDYIQGMGFDAIWITPVVASTTWFILRITHCMIANVGIRQRGRLSWILGTGSLQHQFQLRNSR